MTYMSLWFIFINPFISIAGKFEQAYFQLLIPQKLALANSQTASLAASINDLKNHGSDTSMLATGTYSWTNLDVEDDGSSLPPMTNKDCHIVVGIETTAVSLKALLIAELAKILPVPVAGLTISSPITCAPRYPLQVRDDQASVFTVHGLGITTRYTLFGSDANFVTYTGTVDSTLQQPELLAPLSNHNVRQFVQEALRRIYLSEVEQYYTQQAAALKGLLPSTASAGLPLFIIAAAGGGALILILLIIIILVLRRRRNQP